jgi:hypothetical protein
MTGMSSNEILRELDERHGRNKSEASEAVRRSEWLCEAIARDPGMTGYRKNSSVPYVRNNPDTRVILEEALIHQGRHGFHEALRVLQTAEPDIDLVVFDRYYDLMEPKRLEASLEDIMSGGRRWSRALQGIGYALASLAKKKISEEDFNATVEALEGLGARRFYGSGKHIANMGRESSSYETNNITNMTEFALGLRFLLGRGLSNILGELVRTPDYKTFSTLMLDSLANYRYAMPIAMAIAHDKDKHTFDASEMPLAAHGAVFGALMMQARNLDVDGIVALSKNFDLSKTFDALAADKPMRYSVDRILSRADAPFSPMLVVAAVVERISRVCIGNNVTAQTIEQASVSATAAIKALMDAGLNKYAAIPEHCAIVAKWVDTDIAKERPEFLAMLETTFSLSRLTQDLPHGQLFGKIHSGMECYVLELWRRLEQGREFLNEAIGNLKHGEQETIFANDLLCRQYRLTASDRRYATSERVREDLLSIDLGL